VGELAELYAVFALIYLFECGEIVPRRALGLAPWLGRWRARRTFAPNSGWRRGLVFGEPWPPLAPALVTEPVPLIVGPDGIGHGGGGDGGDDARFVPWGEVQDVAADGARLLVNGEPVAALATRRGARALAQAFGGLARLPRDKRETRLARWLDDRFDVTAARARLPVLLRETRALRVAANVLWAGLFVGLPALLWTPYVHLLLVPVGAVSVVAWIVAAALFVRALRRSSWLDRALRPDLAKRITAIASPLATIRAADHIARELCGDLDPLAVAAALLPPAGVRRLGRSLLCDLRFRDPDDVPAGSEDDARWLRAETLARVERALRACDIDPQALLAPPARDDAMAAWCPVCLAQYREAGEPRATCANVPCRGIALRGFADAAPSGDSAAR
jgi:hypothetical protein